MPTQGLPRAAIAERWGVLDGFVPAPDDNPISRGMAAGRVTDDTDQAAILGRLLIVGGGRLDPYAFAAALLGWQQVMVAQGSLDLLGPSTLRALEALRAGTPIEETGRLGDTNGAAMRVAPVGLAVPSHPLARLVDAVEDASRLTHHTGIAVAGAAAVAAAVSIAVEGQGVEAAIRHAVAAARLGAARGAPIAGAHVADRIEQAVRVVRAARSATAVLDIVDRLVGTSLATQESVPAAFALVAAFPDDPWELCRHAASVGGDCDTIAAMAGAIGGALHGAAAFPAAAVEALVRANPDLGLEPLSRDLLALRPSAGVGVSARAHRPASVSAPAARLVLAGSVVVDLVLPVRSLPPRGGDVLADDVATTVGGGFYVLAAAAGAGLPAAFLGRHGSGPMGDRVREALARIVVPALLPATAGGDTGLCVTLVEPDGERTFVTNPGVEAHLDAGDLERAGTGPADLVYVSGYDLGYPDSGPAIAAWLAGRPPGAVLIVDPGPLVASITAEVLGPVLARCTVLTLNRREATQLTGTSEPGAVARALRDRLAPAALLVVRDGARGAYVAGPGVGMLVTHVPVEPVRAVDSTGAGDVHTGTLAAALARGHAPVAAVRIANTAAAALVGGPRPWSQGTVGGER